MESEGDLSGVKGAAVVDDGGAWDRDLLTGGILAAGDVDLTLDSDGARRGRFLGDLVLLSFLGDRREVLTGLQSGKVITGEGGWQKVALFLTR
jgi:hypothetical protein